MVGAHKSVLCTSTQFRLTVKVKKQHFAVCSSVCIYDSNVFYTLLFCFFFFSRYYPQLCSLNSDSQLNVNNATMHHPAQRLHESCIWLMLMGVCECVSSLNALSGLICTYEKMTEISVVLGLLFFTELDKRMNVFSKFV